MTAFPRLFKIPKHSNNYVISLTAKLNIYPVPLFINLNPNTRIITSFYSLRFTVSPKNNSIRNGRVFYNLAPPSIAVKCIWKLYKLFNVIKTDVLRIRGKEHRRTGLMLSGGDSWKFARLFVEDCSEIT
jgi:hypothetical protein